MSMIKKSNQIRLTTVSNSSECFDLICYYQDCQTIDNLFNEFQDVYEKLQAFQVVNSHRCASYLSTLLAGCNISEEALMGTSTAVNKENSGGSILKSIWVRIKNIFISLYTAIKTFFRRLFDKNVRYRKSIIQLMNDFNIHATAQCKTNLNGLQLTLVPKVEFQEIIDHLGSLYSKIHRSGISGDPSDLTPFIQASFKYFRINVQDGVVLSSISDLKPITLKTARLDDPSWGWGDGNILEGLNIGTKMLVEVLTQAEALNIQSTGLENECNAALRKIEQYSASGKVDDAIKTQDELYATQKRANFVISINKVYQAYVSQLAEIFRAAWTNLNNFNKTK